MQKTVEVPQLQFSDKVVDIPVVVLKNTAEARGDSTGAVLGQVEVCPLLSSRYS